MRSYFKGKTLFLEFNGITVPLYYVCSVAKFKGSLIAAPIRWKTEGDATVLLPLLERAQSAPTLDLFKTLATYEGLYQELTGRAPGSHNQANASRRDLMSVGSRSKNGGA